MLLVWVLLACAGGAAGESQLDVAKRAKGLSDEELDRLAERWQQEDGQKKKKPKRTPAQFTQDVLDADPQGMLGGGKAAGQAMMFSQVHYAGCCSDAATRTLSQRWDSMLRSSGMVVSTYAINDNTILFSTHHGAHAGEIQEFLLMQVSPEPATPARGGGPRGEPTKADSFLWLTLARAALGDSGTCLLP